MRDPGNILEVSRNISPDFMGFIFYAASKRFISGPIPDTSGIKRVGVFVNEEVSRINEIAEEYKLDYVQLHGDEDLDFVERLSVFPVKIIKVFRVGDSIDYSQLRAFEPFVAYFLFDTETSKYGGSGKSFDWQLLNGYPLDTPFFIGGGLSPENFKRVTNLEIEKFSGVDLNSGFEIEPGLKDIELLDKTLKRNAIPGR